MVYLVYCNITNEFVVHKILKNFNFKENYKVYFLVFAFFLFVFTSHLPGLSWTIIFYVLASALVKD